VQRGLLLAQPASPVSPQVEFGPFRADLQTGELWANGKKIKLEGQPFQLLALLLEKPGQLVTREEIPAETLAADTFVDFEHSINTAIKRLREVLGTRLNRPALSRRFRARLPLHLSGERSTHTCKSAGSANGLVAQELGRGLAGTRRAACRSAGSKRRGLRDRITGRTGVGPIASVAVLPCKNLTGDSLKQEFLADGLTDVLTTYLAQVNR